LKRYGSIFDLEFLSKRIDTIEKEMSGAKFWYNRIEAEKLVKELKTHKSVIEPFNDIENQIVSLRELAALCDSEEDEAIAGEIAPELKKLTKEIDKFELRILLSGKHDNDNALMNIHPGAGGTEAQDWVEMLLRLYTKYLENNDYEYKFLDLQPGDEAGIKNVTLEIRGDFAYGKLRAENGIHRLVRISPFDSGHRRHTSFASVLVYPEIDEEIEVEIKPDDLRVDTYRASGAGGQHVNKTSSAVRLTHYPTGIVVQCQNERSQHRNKETAMKVLRSRIYAKLLEEEEKQKAKLAGEKQDISWGHQIRSYVFHPYTMVKDHRTGIQTGSIIAVMDGKIEEFIEGYLRWKERKE
jgi:peptide chain release factor 2